MSTKIEVIVDQRMLKDGKKNEDFEGLEGEVSNVLQRFISLRIGISMENISNTFSFSVPFMLGKGLRTGMPVKITMGGKNILVGYINALNRSLRSDNAMVEVSGRSKTGDLVDCQVKEKHQDTISFKNLLMNICKPFGISVVYKVDEKKNPCTLKSIGVRYKEPYMVFAEIAACNGLLLMSDGDGNLVVDEAEPKPNTFVITQGNMGLAILSVDHAQTTEEFSTYTAIKQSTFHFNDACKPMPNPNTNPLALDTPMRHRPCAFGINGTLSVKEVAKRTAFEYYRKTPNTLIIKVHGWGYVDEEGTMCPWAINQVHRLIIKELDIVDGKNNSFLIESVEFNLSNDGRTTTLTLCHPNKYNKPKDGKKA